MGGPSSSLASAAVGSRTLTECGHYQDTPALVQRAYSGALPPHQSVMPVGPLGQPQTTQISGVQADTMSINWQGYNDTLISGSHFLQQASPQVISTVSLPSSLPNQLQAPEIQESQSLNLSNTFECIASAPLLPGSDSVPALMPSNSVLSLTLNSALPKISASLNQEQCSTSDTKSFSSAKATLTSYSGPVNLNTINMSSFPSAPVSGKIVSDLVSVPPIHPMHNSASTIGGSTSGLLLTPPPTLLTPNQLVQPISSMLSSSQKIYLDQMDKIVPSSISPNTLSTVSTPALQAPLLPLPVSSQQVS